MVKFQEERTINNVRITLTTYKKFLIPYLFEKAPNLELAPKGRKS